MASYYTLLLALLCPLLLLLIKRCRAKTRDDELFDKLPSPPGRLPVIGHLHLIGSLPYVSFRELAIKHGPDLMLLHLGTVPTLVVSSARAAQAILRTNDHVFASRTYSAVTDILFYGSSDVAFSPYGEYWRQVKKIATTHLLTNKKVRSYGKARQQEVRLVMARINEAAVARTTVDLSELLNWFTNDIVCHAVSGKFFREEGRNQMRLLCAKAHNVNKRWDQLLDKLIDDHATKRSSSVLDLDNEESDFIDVLLSIQHEYGLTRDNVKAILVIMFEGGMDTTYIELEYAMAELIRKPQLMAKLQAEVRSVVPRGQEIVTEEQLGRMPYLKAVIKETLRLHLAGPLLVPHLSIAECDIEGYTIPSGTRVFVNAWALSRDPSFWENAEEFIPERFLNSIAPDYNGNNFHFLPFGSGRRICPGINFAIATIEIMLANLVYRFDWEILADQAAKGGIDMTEAFGLTVHRKEKLLLVPRLTQD
uniref:Cytochrome P450 n=1 Tax=Oryza barthii TaxID=65489 RepID=A0A0D3GVI8_9ORYZ